MYFYVYFLQLIKFLLYYMCQKTYIDLYTKCLKYMMNHIIITIHYNINNDCMI